MPHLMHYVFLPVELLPKSLRSDVLNWLIADMRKDLFLKRTQYPVRMIGCPSALLAVPFSGDVLKRILGLRFSLSLLRALDLGRVLAVTDQLARIGLLVSRLAQRHFRVDTKG